MERKDVWKENKRTILAFAGMSALLIGVMPWYPWYIQMPLIVWGAYVNYKNAVIGDVYLWG